MSTKRVIGDEGINSREIAAHLHRLADFLDAEASRRSALDFLDHLDESNGPAARMIVKEAQHVRALANELHELKEMVGVVKPENRL